MTTDEQPMHGTTSLASATLVLLAALALIAVAVFLPRASAGRPAHLGRAPAKVVTVVIRQFKFEPETVTVHAGDTLKWKNDDIVPHTATADGVWPAFDSQAIPTGAEWRFIARRKGMYNYTCTLHPNMKGKLIVQ